VSKIIRHGEEHHWWPIGLSKGWARPDGKINTISQHGVPKAYFPKQIAKIPDGHNILVGGPWNETFEPQFNQPDNNFPAVVKWLEGTHSEPYGTANRVRPIEMSADWKLKLSQCIASLIVRSPTMRHRIVLTVQSFYQRGGGAQNYQVPKHLIGANMKSLYKAFSQSIDRSGRFAIMVSEKKEFIFGDGFLHNFPITWMPEPMNPLCLVPLSPKVTVLFQRPSSMWSEPKAVALTLSPEEVAFCNETIEVYSKDWLYYHERAPSLSHFQEGKHLEWSMPGIWDSTPHATPLFEQLKEEVMAYNPYGD
jgi:hypothetical protein